MTPRPLKAGERRELVKELKRADVVDARRTVDQWKPILGSRVRPFTSMRGIDRPLLLQLSRRGLSTLPTSAGSAGFSVLIVTADESGDRGRAYWWLRPQPSGLVG